MNSLGANGFMKLNASTIVKLGLTRSMLDPNIYSRVTDGVTLHVGCSRASYYDPMSITLKDLNTSQTAPGHFIIG